MRSNEKEAELTKELEPNGPPLPFSATLPLRLRPRANDDPADDSNKSVGFKLESKGNANFAGMISGLNKPTTGYFVYFSGGKLLNIKFFVQMY